MPMFASFCRAGLMRHIVQIILEPKHISFAVFSCSVNQCGDKSSAILLSHHSQSYSGEDLGVVKGGHPNVLNLNTQESRLTK